MNKVIVKINGSEYPIVGEKSELHMLKVGRYVDSEMTKAMENNPKLSTSQAAVLTAINITDTFFECCEENEELVKENEELNKKVGATDGEIRFEVNKLKLRISQLKENEEKSNKSIEELNKTIEVKDKEKTELNELLINKAEAINSYKNEIEELKKLLEEANQEAEISQKMCSKFQNDAYRIQLEKIEIENELKFHKVKG